MTVEPGRSGENWDDLPRIAAGDSFDFVCAGCGGCCRGRRDLVLSGYDLYRIARRLGLSPRIVAGAFCKSYLAPQTLLPALRLTPDPRTGNCRFFEGSACAIHAARPRCIMTTNWGTIFTRSSNRILRFCSRFWRSCWHKKYPDLIKRFGHFV